MTTRDKIKELRERDPSIKAVNLAHILGVSRERIRQILEDENMPTRFDREKKYCKVCDKQLYLDNKTGFCWEHWTAKEKAKSTLTLICPVCKRPFALQKSQLKARLARNNTISCSYSCGSK